MSNATVTYREIRFVIDDDLTHVYVLCEAAGDCPIGVQGWHHKAFGDGTSIQDILASHMWTGDEDGDPILWPQDAPRSERSRA